MLSSHSLKPRRLASLAVIAAGLLIAATGGHAAPVTYSLSAGQLSSVQVGAFGSGSPCPIGSGSCLQGGPLALTSASITIDTATNQLISISIGVSTAGTIVLGGFNGLQSVTFANTSLSSTAISSLANPQVLGNGDVVYSFGFQGNVSSIVTPLGGSATPVSFLSGAGGLLTLSGGELSLQLFGADLGMVCGVGNTCQAIKADFTLTAGSPPVPEPSAFAAFGAGLALLFAAARRRGLL